MYTREQVLDKIKEVLIQDFDCPEDKLTEQAKLFEDLDLDSIDAVDLVVRLQSFINKRVDPESFQQIRTLSDIADAVLKLVNEK